MQTGAATVENSMEFPQKTKNGTAFWPGDSTSGNLSEETQNTHLKEYVHIYIHYGIIYNKHILETTQVPVNRWVDKKAVVHIQWNITCP